MAELKKRKGGDKEEEDKDSAPEGEDKKKKAPPPVSCAQMLAPRRWPSGADVRCKPGFCRRTADLRCGCC
jgi:hypothetical protein